MIDEAIGKILGMAMAYVASVLGMFVAYVNYRRRIVKADRIMSTAAWVVVVISVVGVGAGVLVVAQLATAPAGAEAAPLEAAAVEEPAVPAEPDVAEGRGRWPLVGMIVPALIFLLATVITAGLHRHFSAHGH